MSRIRARVDAKKRPSNRSPPSSSIRFCQFWALKFSRSKIPASSAEIGTEGHAAHHQSLAGVRMVQTNLTRQSRNQKGSDSAHPEPSEIH